MLMNKFKNRKKVEAFNARPIDITWFYTNEGECRLFIAEEDIDEYYKFIEGVKNDKSLIEAINEAKTNKTKVTEFIDFMGNVTMETLLNEGMCYSDALGLTELYCSAIASIWNEK